MELTRQLLTQNKALSILLPTIALISTIVLSIAVGSVAISTESFVTAVYELFSLPRANWNYETIIVWQLRLPRTLLSALVGASLATVGAVLQGLLHNGMADSHVLGVSSGASLGASIAMLFGLSFPFLGLGAITPMAFLGAISTLILVIAISRRVASKSTLSLLLAGIAMSSFLSSLVSLIVYFSGDRIQPIVFWLMGGFSARRWSHIFLILPYFLIGFILSFIYNRYLTAISLGDATAHNLGVNVEKIRYLLLGVAALLTAAAVSVSGGIGFVGLIMPHIAKMFVGHNYRRMLPASAFLGAIFLTLADVLARTIIRPTELPVGIITAMFGGPFFLYLLSRKRGST